MLSLVILLNFLSYGALTALLAALIACGVRRWQLSSALSGAVLLGGPVIFLANVAVSMILPLAASNDPSTKAIVMSQGISEVMNCSGIALVASLVGAPIWSVSRRRLRAAAAKVGADDQP